MNIKIFNKNFKKFFTFTTTIFLIGCGGGGGSSTQNKSNIQTIKGKVIDGYVKGATVCIDLNNNFKCDKNEPFTITDAYGNYSLKIKDNKTYILISQGGINIENNTPAITMYSNTKYKNITPLTSLAIKEGEKKVSQFFNIPISDIAKDPMKNNELKNIIQDIVNNFLITKKYQLPINNTFVDIKQDTNKQYTTNSNKTTNSTEETISNNVSTTSGTDNIPPQISGNLTPPKIGE